jgi:hypothetical protein
MAANNNLNKYKVSHISYFSTINKYLEDYYYLILFRYCITYKYYLKRAYLDG